MEAYSCKRGYVAAEDYFCDIKPVKRHDWRMEEAQKYSVGRHGLSNSECRYACSGPKSEELKTGFLYEIEYAHLPNGHLPRKSPLELEGNRAVMVTEVNEVNVTVRAPSSLSLRTYFSDMNSLNGAVNNVQGNSYPELDRRFTMSLNVAKEIIVRQIPPTEVMRQRHLQSFWVLPSKITKPSTSTISRDPKNEAPAGVYKDLKNETSAKGVHNDLKNETPAKGVYKDPKNGTSAKGVYRDPKSEASAKGLCWLSLKCPGVLHWANRRKVTYEKTPRVPSLTCFIKEEEDFQLDIKPKDERKSKTQKRKCEDTKHNKKSKVAKLEMKKPSSELRKLKLPKLKVSYGWWSQNRYKGAEVKMFEITREKGAVVGKPILRQALRIEARKHIGDTGLLDHVLKHMADKVSPNGQYRFRRRHNADGAMEYWLESADLVNVRRQAGVRDPYWTPPPGWRPGDNPSHDPNWAWELQLLKEEMFNIKKDVQELHLLKREDEVDKAVVISSAKSSSDSCNLESDTEVSLQEDYENLVKRKTQIEQQLAHSRKRKYEGWKLDGKTKDAKREVKKFSSKSSSRISDQKMKLSYGRWSTDRYKNAEVKMLEVMKAKGAVAAKPMIRQTLRLDVRKHIGDTGLLDHILKHMADKVAPNGLDRFRRRHNADGAMEYWLESADLVNIRKEAGVRNPYWIPPLGWKPGDNPFQGPNYSRELKLLKEEMSIIEREMQELLVSTRDDEAIVVTTKSSSESCSLESDTTVASFQEDYENLVRRKTPLEHQQAQISGSLNGMQESIRVGNNFHIPQLDATSISGIHHFEQESIASFQVGPHHTHGSAAIDLNNFFRSHPCDFVTSQPLDTEPKESSFYLLV